MAFTGNIADWSLADILQVVAAERKSGVLNLAHPDGAEIELEFREGQISRATDRPENGQPGGFTAFLAETGQIKPDQLRGVAKLRHETGDDEFEALERAGMLAAPAHEGAFGAYCQELIYRALTWREGDYRFVAKSRGGASPARRHVQAIDAFLMEGMRRIDEAPRIQEVVQPETVFERAADPRAVAGLGRREHALIALVDGAKDARTLGRLAHLTEFEAGELLFNLHEAGLIRARRGPDPLVLDLVEDLPSAGSQLAQLVRLAVILGVIAATLVLSWRGHSAVAHRAAAAAAGHSDPRLTEAEAFARELFRAYAGREPASRKELERAELLVPRPPLEATASLPAPDPTPLTE
jgi:hypothetical protein